jgi:enamine deaminase RidA (YjgF/YER057c/UK114 family)
MNRSIERHGVTTRWSDAVAFGKLLYFVEVPDDPNGTAEQQFHQVLRQVEERLRQGSSDIKSLLQVLIFLPNPGDLSTFNSIWDAWVPNGHAPVRACIHATLAAPGYRVELVVTAARGIDFASMA